MKSTIKLIAGGLLATSLSALAQSTLWTGQGASPAWNDPLNWDTGVPDATKQTWFEDVFYTGYTNAPGQVNNVVTAGSTAGALVYNANSFSATNHFFTTLIPEGVSLTVGGFGSAFPAFCVGDVPVFGFFLNAGNWTNYSTITGAGSLVVNDAASLMSVGQRNRATLDLSGLNTFSATVQQVLVGASFDNPNTTAILGTVLLAKTNTLTTSANPSAPGVILGSLNGANNNAGVLALGGTNVINTDGLVVGGRRSSSATILGFAAAYSNTVTAGNLKLRGSAGGNSRVGTFSIGDMAAQPTDYLGSPAGSTAGTADFSGGSVDILADAIYVGRSAPDTGPSVTFINGFGALTLEQGTVDANNLYIAYKQGTNASSAVGSSSASPACLVTLRSNVQVTVNQDVIMAYRNKGTNGSQTPFGALVVNDSATISIGGNVTTPTNGISTLQLGGGTVNMTGAGSLTNTTLTGFGTITGATSITVVSNLAPGGVARPGTLNLGGNLVLANPLPLTFDLGPSATVGGGVNDHISVTGDVTFNNNPLAFTFNGPLLAGSTYHLIDFTGSRSGNVAFTNLTRSAIGVDEATPGHLDLIVTNWNPATLKWVGNANGISTNNVWNLTDTNWSNGGSPDRFFALDDVVFDDTAAFTNIFPNGALYANSITIDGTKNFALTNRSSAGPWAGWIAGNCTLTKNGTGTFLLGCYSNISTGPILVNNGILKPFDPTFTTPGNNTVLGATSAIMYVTNAGTFDINGIGAISSGKTIVIKGAGFNGLGAITNAVSNSGATMNGYFLSLAGDATISADVGGWGIRGLTSSGPFYSGSLKLNGYTLTKLGAARFQMQEVVAADAGNINFGGGNLSLRDTVLTGAGTLTFSNNTYLQFPYLAGATSYVAKAISTTGNFGIAAPDSSSQPGQVLIDSPINLGGPLSVTNNQILVFGGPVSGANNLTKYGNSNLVLNAANTYSGTTMVNAGTLSLGASGSVNNSPALVINPGATLDITAKAGTYTVVPSQTLTLNGTAVGDVTVGANATLLGAGLVMGSLTLAPGSETALGTTNVTGTMTIASNLNLAAGHLTWEVGTASELSDGLLVNGNLNLTGTNVFAVNSIGGFDSTGTNTLITYAGTLTGGLTNLALTGVGRFVVEFVDPALTPGKIQIRLVTPSPLLTWKGANATNPRNWDVQTTPNWDKGGSPDVFWSSDLVRFDDSANTNIVNLVGTLGPAAISMENAGVSYTFGGSGGLVSSSLTNGSGNLTLTNTANSFFTGVGLVLNGGNVTFAQPTHAALTANLNGAGTFTKAGNSNLLLIGSAANFSGTINVNAGQLRAGSTNAVASTVNVNAGGTLDVNGQLLPAAIVSANGAGADGWGAINNRGPGRTNNLANVTLASATTFGALSNAWGISGTLIGNGFALTKTNAQDVWIQTGTDTDLGDIDVRQGRLVFGQTGTTLGRAANTVIVRPGATLALAATNAMPQSGPGVTGIAAGDKPLVLTNSTLESIGFSVNQTTVNSHGGPILITTNGVFKVGGNSRLVVNGDISGNGQLIVTNNGTLHLNGTNTYGSNTFVYSGTLVLSNQYSLPTNSTLAVSNLSSTFGNASVEFEKSPVFTNTMLLSSRNGQVSVGGDGVWGGPIFMYGSNAYNFRGGLTLLDLAGPLITTNAGGSVAFHGYNTRVAGPLVLNGAPVTIGVGDGLGADIGVNFTTVRFEKSNLWTTTTIDRGRVNIGAHNAIPPTSAIRVGTLSAGVFDRRVTFDLGGYHQTISSLTEAAVGDSLVLIGNSSTNADSTLTYAGTGTNTWGVRIVDDLDSPAIPFTTALTVTSGVLNLVNTNTYTGATLVGGGTLNLVLGSGLTAGYVGQLGSTPVTVTGTGTLGGNGLVAGSVTVSGGGTLSPGTSIGQLTINKWLTLGNGGKYLCEVNLGTGTNDKVVGITTLTLGGTLVLNNIGSQPYTNGTAIKLFEAASYVAGPVAIQPASPGNGLMWDASTLATDGTLRVTTVAPLGVADVARLGDGNVSFSVTGTVGQGYTIRATSDAAAPLAGWTTLQSGTLSVSPLVFTDLTATNYPYRFYSTSTP